MPFEDKIEKALSQAADYYIKAWKEKPSLEDALSRIGCTAKRPSSFDMNCYAGMKILLSLCGSKFSEKHIRDLLPVFYNLLDKTSSLSQQQASDMLHHVYQKFLDWHEEITVYFPVEGIKVNGSDAVIFGKVSFWNFDELLKEKKHGVQLDKTLSAQINIPETLASYSMIAEPKRAQEIGKQTIIDTLNAIQFINPMFMVHELTPHFLLMGDAQQSKAFSLCEHDGMINLFSTYLTGSFYHLLLPLSVEHEKKWNEGFGNDAIDVVQSQSSGQIIDILRQAIYWHAVGERENSCERALIYYTMALEAVLTKMGSGLSVQTTIADSLALLLGKNIDSRLAIKKKSKDLYSLRSQLAHGNKTSVKKKDLETQRYFSYSAIKFIFSMRHVFHGRDDITSYFENLKFTLPEPTASAHVSNDEEKDA